MILTERISISKYAHKEIITVDFSNTDLENKDFIKELTIQGTETIKKYPEKSALVLTKMANMRFDKELINIFIQYASNNKPYVKASAIVGVTGLQKIAFDTIQKISQRDFKTFSDEQTALDWLLAQ